MKVFYVVVLVLVAGAVPSYGRTESEGTVFNKTQIHESMNNGTESSSKSVGYNNLYLAMQWPKSFCSGRNCFQGRGHFTVHGLWPQINPDPRQYIDCSTRCRPNMLLRPSQPSNYLWPGLNEYWPKLDASALRNHEFWKEQYDKHGCCIFQNPNDYFYRTLTMVESLGDLALKLSLSARPILPGHSYMPIDIINAVHDVTQLWPLLVCKSRNSRRPQLYEIRFLYSHDFRPIPYTGQPLYCGNGVVDFLAP